MQDIVLVWERDARGYHLVEETPVELPPNPLMPEGWRPRLPEIPGARIVRQGGSLIPYRPAATLDLIFREFLNSDPTPAGMLDFVNRFGPLIRAGNCEAVGQPVSTAINTLELMTDLIEANALDKEAHKRALQKVLGADGIRLAGIEVHLVFDERTQTPRTQQVVCDLQAALYLKLFEVMLSDIVLRRCGQCNALFAAGLGTGRHLNAKFCCDEHRILFNSLKRTPRAA
jgi:hypothetical protein